MRLFCLLLLLLCAHFAIGFNPNELKPCFERYDGFKIVNAVPFHSEWRIKFEEWCLEFCVRASSRCMSIVYDKHSHICHYFSVNGIEEEKITKNPRMVYFQISEKSCVEKMQNKIEQEEQSRREHFEQQQNLTTPVAQPTETVQFSTDQPTMDEASQQPTTLEAVSITENEFDASPQMENIGTTIVTEATFPVRSFGEQENNEMTTAGTVETTKDEEEFDGDPMSFVRRFQFEKEEIETGKDPLFPMQSDKIVVPTTKTEIQTTTVPEPETTISEEPQTTIAPSTTISTTTESTVRTEQTTVRTEQTTTTPEKTTTTGTLPRMVDPMISFADQAAAILPVMNKFKAVRRPLPTKTSLEVEKKNPEMIEVRRSPSRQTLTESMTDHPKYTGQRPIAQKFNIEPEPTVLQADDDETMLADNVPVLNDCSEGMQEIWLAVENSQVNSSVRTSVIKVANQPTECMETCQTLFIGKHPCDSFTFIEPAKRCIFHSSHSGFHVKPSALNDFSTRAFRRFCYPESLSPFSDCAEFLAFRDYTLDITPREIFEDLPLGNEGLSACIELCVLSREFRCKSATFNTKNGTCMIFSEHSLSKPSNFKANTDLNRLYFENGCIEMKSIPDSAIQDSNVKRVQPVLLDYRKLSMH